MVQTPLGKNKVSVITYRKNVKDKWNECLFIDTETQLFNNNVPMRLCEMGTPLSGAWFREIRKLSENGHQTAILTTHPNLSIQLIAGKMFSRWTQKNFFKYVLDNFDFDRMIEYGTEEIDQRRTTLNPEYRKLTNQLKKLREKKARLEAKMYNKIESEDEKTIEEVKKYIIPKLCDYMEKSGAKYLRVKSL